MSVTGLEKTSVIQ